MAKEGVCSLCRVFKKLVKGSGMCAACYKRRMGRKGR